MAHAIVVAASNVHSFQHRQALGAVFDHRVDPGGVERADITERDISQRVETTLIVTATPHEPVAQHPATRPRQRHLRHQRTLHNSHDTIMTKGYPTLGWPTTAGVPREGVAAGRKLESSVVTRLEHLELFPCDCDVADEAPSKSAP